MTSVLAVGFGVAAAAFLVGQSLPSCLDGSSFTQGSVICTQLVANTRMNNRAELGLLLSVDIGEG